MKKPKDSALIAIGQYNWKKRKMTCKVFDSDNKQVIWKNTVSGGTKEIADFLSSAESFRILYESIETEKEYSVIYITDFNTLREVQAANCVSGLYLDMYNFEEIIEQLEDDMDFLDSLGLKFLKERTSIWDKYIMGDVKLYLDEKEN
jgi:hypothetical protein